eukprot:jgi/Chrpa1/22006/Chrysochromulina_OHIO_Genome00025261-RA
MPTPRRLATILVVAGAQTGHALAPPTQAAPPNSARHLGPTSLATAAAIGAVAGSLLNQHLEAEPCFTFSYVDTSLMPAEFAFLGDRIASGLMTPMQGHHDGSSDSQTELLEKYTSTSSSTRQPKKSVTLSKPLYQTTGV